MAVIKVKPWGKDQGDHVLINEEDFNPDVHELYGAPPKGKDYSKMKVDEIKALLTEKGITFDAADKKEDLIKLIPAE